MDTVQHERRRLIERLREVGPEAPTLCAGWQARDLLLHLIRREIIPHRVIGSWMPSRVGDESGRRLGEVEDAPFDDLLELFDSGRQKYSPLKIGVIDTFVNTLEYVIHTEDISRAQTPIIEEAYSDEAQRDIFSRLGAMAQVLLARSPVTVRLNAGTFGTKQVFLSKRHDREVTVSGEPVELALFCFGRDDAAKVTFEGRDEDVEAVKKARLSI